MSDKKTIIVFGANGMLGRRVIESLVKKKVGKAYGLTSADCDITDPEAVSNTVAEFAPDVIINCAAYTAVDKAEDDAEAADKVNNLAAGYLAKAAKTNDALLIHVSTDYVFDGEATQPYTEEMRKAPLGVYGKTKSNGEDAIIATGCKHVIVRTQWLYDADGKNFFLTMLRLFGEKDELNVVNDQTGSPTYAGDLAKALVKIALEYEGQDGIYQFANYGTCTWYDFAMSIAQIAEAETEIHPVSTDKYPTRARRPHYSVLSTEKIANTFGVKVPHWRQALNRCFNRLRKNNE